MTPHECYRTDPRVRLRKENDDDFLVYYDEKGYATNNVGARLIELCRGMGATADDLVTKLSSEFDATKDEIARDVSAMLSDLCERRIVVCVPEGDRQ